MFCSHLFRGDNADITPDNEYIRSVVKSVLSEAFQLYTAQGNTISVDKGDGKEISLIQVSKSTSSYQYTINDSRYNWIENVVNASIGVDMSQNEGIDCLQNRLHVLRQKLSQDSKVSCNTPREPDELPEATIDDEMISDVDDPMVEPTVTFESSSDSALDVTSDESEVSSDSEGSVDVPKIADET